MIQPFVDIFFEEPTPADSLLGAALNEVDYSIVSTHIDDSGGLMEHVIPLERTGLSDYVIGNIYRPSKISGRLPAVLYLCGHSKGKVNERYQANARWFGQHGYVALVLDPIQLGEAQGFHHGSNYGYSNYGYSNYNHYAQPVTPIYSQPYPQPQVIHHQHLHYSQPAYYPPVQSGFHYQGCDYFERVHTNEGF